MPQPGSAVKGLSKDAGVRRFFRLQDVKDDQIKKAVHLLPGEPAIELCLRRSARTQRFSLRVSRLDGRVTLTLPHGASEEKAMAFLRRQKSWLRQTLAELPAAMAQEIGFGTFLPIEGRLYQIRPGEARTPRIEGDNLLVGGESPARRVGAFLKELARQRLLAAVEYRAGMVGRDYARITLRETRSRWGSCNAQGALMFSWRLIMAPPEVLDYVVAHEVAHLVEMNHSAAFWKIVESLRPDWKTQRLWLRENGAALHQYRFGG